MSIHAQKKASRLCDNTVMVLDTGHAILRTLCLVWANNDPVRSSSGSSESWFRILPERSGMVITARRRGAWEAHPQFYPEAGCKIGSAKYS